MLGFVNRVCCSTAACPEPWTNEVYGAVHGIRWDEVVIVDYAMAAAGPGCTMAVTGGEKKQQQQMGGVMP